MKISLNWINDFTDIKHLDPRDIAEKLTVRTAETEGIYTVGEHNSNIVSACIKEAEQITEKHYKCIVEAGKQYTVISGAPNTRCGVKCVLVKPGGVLNDTLIENRTIAGVQSEGMLLSGRELGINNDHSGIMLLDDAVKPNTDINEIIEFNDSIIEIDNKSLTHRPDLWGIYGFAREIAAIYGLELKPYTVLDPSQLGNAQPPSIDIIKRELCFRYIGIRINNVKYQTSPLFIQSRLTRTEHTPRNLIVDLTNYVMAELGQPLHAFDGDRIENIVVDTAMDNEMFVTLDGAERTLNSNTLMIKNGSSNVAIAGIMGGGNSEINEGSTSIFLESANFNAGHIRKTSSAMGLRTDSSARFEKSLDPEYAYLGAMRYMYLLKQHMPDAVFESKPKDANYNPFSSSCIEIDYNHVFDVIGTNIGKERVNEILRSLEFIVEEKEEKADVTAPTFRSTKDIAIEADIIEEIARMYGFENIEPLLPSPVIKVPIRNIERITENMIRHILTYEYQMNESDSYIWYDNRFNKMINFRDSGAVGLVNPVSGDNTHLRSSMAPIMLKSAYENLKYFNAFSLYEMGPVFSQKGEKNVLSIISVKEKCKHGDEQMFLYLKEIITYIAQRMNIEQPQLKRMNTDLLNPVNSSVISFGGSTSGFMGTVHPSFNRILDKKVHIGFMQTDMSALHYRKPDIQFKPYPPYPVTELDFSIMKPSEQTFAHFTSNIESFEHPLIIDSRIVYVYESRDLGNYHSVTLRYVLGSNEHTLTSEDIDSFQEAFIGFIGSKGYKLR